MVQRVNSLQCFQVGSKPLKAPQTQGFKNAKEALRWLLSLTNKLTAQYESSVTRDEHSVDQLRQLQVYRELLGELLSAHHGQAQYRTDEELYAICRDYEKTRQARD